MENFVVLSFLYNGYIHVMKIELSFSGPFSIANWDVSRSASQLVTFKVWDCAIDYNPVPYFYVAYSTSTSWTLIIFDSDLAEKPNDIAAIGTLASPNNLNIHHFEDLSNGEQSLLLTAYDDSYTLHLLQVDRTLIDDI